MLYFEYLKNKITTNQAPPAAPFFSQGVAIDNFIFTAGQIALSEQGIEAGLVSEGVAEQTHQIIKNIKAILEEAGSSIDKVIKVTIYLTDMSFYSEMNEVYATYFNIKCPPAREALAVKELPLEAKVEMSVIAYK